LRSVVRELQSIMGASDGGEAQAWSGEASASDVSDALDMVLEAQALLESAVRILYLALHLASDRSDTSPK
jgi:hypothetical protein